MRAFSLPAAALLLLGCLTADPYQESTPTDTGLLGERACQFTNTTLALENDSICDYCHDLEGQEKGTCNKQCSDCDDCFECFLLCELGDLGCEAAWVVCTRLIVTTGQAPECDQ